MTRPPDYIVRRWNADALTRQNWTRYGPCQCGAAAGKPCHDLRHRPIGRVYSLSVHALRPDLLCAEPAPTPVPVASRPPVAGWPNLTPVFLAPSMPGPVTATATRADLAPVFLAA